MILTNIENLINEADTRLPMIKKAPIINNPNVFKAPSQIAKETSTNIQKLAKQTRNPSALRKEATVNALTKQKALRSSFALRQADAKRDMLYAKAGIKTNTATV